MKVWKFVLIPMPGQIIQYMPRNARVISGHVQGNFPTIWAEVDPTLPLVKRTFNLVQTGDVCDGTFIATFLLDDGTYVLHLYEIGEIEEGVR
jgi:hypothetical protein